MKRGTAELAKREEELRTLQIESAELVRQLGARQKEVPKISEYIQKLEERQKQLAALRARTSELSIQLGLFHPPVHLFFILSLSILSLTLCIIPLSLSSHRKSG